MTREEIIRGLIFTVEMFLLDPSTGERYTEPRNDMDKITIDACRGAIELLEQEPNEDMTIAYLMGLYADKKPCEDAISREDVVNTMHIIMDGAYIGDNDEDSNCYESLDDIKEQYIEIAKGMKSVTQEPKTGHWIKHEWAEEDHDRLIPNYECSECHEWVRDNSYFCPNCGTNMRGDYDERQNDKP